MSQDNKTASTTANEPLNTGTAAAVAPTSQPPVDNRASVAASSAQQQDSAAPAPAPAAQQPPSTFPITVSLIPEYPALPKSTFQFSPISALVVVQSGASDVPRPPFELAMLCDVSGSMAGRRIHECREAAHAVVNHLENDDIIHIIPYNAEATLAVSGGPSMANRLHERIDALGASGSTNIEGALNLAYGILHNSKNRNHTKRCFLFSDGQPTTGEMRVEAFGELSQRFAERDFNISTFGIGEGISPEIMMKIADSGNGHYDFVSERRIQELTNKAFQGLSRLMGTRASLTLAPLNGAKFAVNNSNANSAEIGEYTQVGDFKYDATTRFITRLSFADVNPEALASSSSSENLLPFLKAEFMFQVPDQPLRAPVVITGLGTLGLQEGDDAQRPDRDPTVATLLAMRDCGVMFDKIDTFLENGATNDAIELLREVVSELERHMEHDLDGMVHVQLRRSRRTLERLEAEGSRAARRAQLEIGHQRAAVRDRLSVCDFESSDSSNRSTGFVARRGSSGGRGGGGGGGSPPLQLGGAVLPSRRLRRLSVGGSSSGGDTDSDDTDDDDTDSTITDDDMDSMGRQLS